MAELEMINHMKKSLQALKNKESNIMHRIKEFLFEIIIIVVAVSMSIWFHNISEHNHQQEEVSLFLKELYYDLAYDAKIYEQSKQEFLERKQTFEQIMNLPKGEKVSPEVIGQIRNNMLDFLIPKPTQGRYQSFKYSGKINNIENDYLEGEILDLFEEQTTDLNAKTAYYQQLQESFLNYLRQEVKREEGGGDNIGAVLASDISVNYSTDLSNVDRIIKAYDSCIVKIKNINEIIKKQVSIKE